MTNDQIQKRLGIWGWKLFGYCLPRSVSRLVGTLLLGFLVIGYFLTPLLVLAQTQADCATDPSSDLCHPYPTVEGGLLQILGQGLQVVLGMIGVVAFIMIIAGAARWMTAGGNAEHVDSGKGMIAWAFLGLVLAAAAFAVTDFIFGGLRGALFSP